MTTFPSSLEDELLKMSRTFNYNPQNLSTLTASQLLILASNLHEDKLDPYISEEARRIFMDRSSNLSPLKGLDLKRSMPTYNLIVPTINNRFNLIASSTSNSKLREIPLTSTTPSDSSGDSVESTQLLRTDSTSLASRISPAIDNFKFVEHPSSPISPTYCPLSPDILPIDDISLMNLSEPELHLSEIPYTRQNLYDSIIFSDEIIRKKNSNDLKELIGDLNFAKKLETDWDWVNYSDEVDFLDKVLKTLGDPFEIRSLVPAFPPKWAKNYVRYEPLFLPDLPTIQSSSHSRDLRNALHASGKTGKAELVFIEAQLETLRYLYRNTFPPPIITEATLSYLQGTSFGQYLFHLGEIRRLARAVKGTNTHKGLWETSCSRASKIEQERWNSKMRRAYQALIKGYDNHARRRMIIKEFVAKGYIS